MSNRARPNELRPETKENAPQFGRREKAVSDKAKCAEGEVDMPNPELTSSLVKGSSSPLRSSDSSEADREIELWQFIDLFWAENNQRFAREKREFVKVNGMSNVDSFYARFLVQNKIKFAEFQRELVRREREIFKLHTLKFTSKLWGFICRLTKCLK